MNELRVTLDCRAAPTQCKIDRAQAAGHLAGCLLTTRWARQPRQQFFHKKWHWRDSKNKARKDQARMNKSCFLPSGSATRYTLTLLSSIPSPNLARRKQIGDQTKTAHISLCEMSSQKQKYITYHTQSFLTGANWSGLCPDTRSPLFATSSKTFL